MADIAEIARRAHGEGFEKGSLTACNAILAFLSQQGMGTAAERVLAAWEDGTIARLAGLGAAPAEGQQPAAEPPGMGRSEARAQGYTGDECTNCGSLRMKISGHCQVCEECGTTTGCS